MDIQDFTMAAMAFFIGSFVSSTAFYHILPEIQDIKQEKSIGSIMTCVAWAAVLIVGVVIAFKFGNTAGAFSIVGIASGFMTSYKVTV